MYISAAACMLSAVAISGAVAQSPNSDITTGVSNPSMICGRERDRRSLTSSCLQALGDAIPVTDNPSGAQYVARLPETAFDKAAFPNGGNVNGSIQAVSMPDGHGVMFHVSFSNLPETDAPFSESTYLQANTHLRIDMLTGERLQSTTSTTSPSPPTATAPGPSRTSTPSSAAR